MRVNRMHKVHSCNCQGTNLINKEVIMNFCKQLGVSIVRENFNFKVGKLSIHIRSECRNTGPETEAFSFQF